MVNNADFGAGMVRYKVHVLVPPPDARPTEFEFDYRESDYYEFVNTAPVLPRMGDNLEFDGPGGFSLSLIVTEVTHWFHTVTVDEPGESFNLTVQCEPTLNGLSDARQLLDPVALEGWIAQYPTLELPA